jgi:hypothetical protein
MKHFYLNSVKKFGILYALLFLTGSAFAQLSGTYTIDAKSAASSTNYKTFSALASDLLSGTRSDGGTKNGPAVSGKVTVNVVSGSGPYTEQVSFGAISGVSSTNTITINGNGEILEFSATSSAASFTLQLNGTDYMTVDNLIIRANNTSMGRCVHLLNQATFNTISNCKLQMPNFSSTSNIYFYIGITNGTSSTQTYANSGENNIITKNVMSSGAGFGPYSGIVFMTESSGTTVRKNTFSDNKIADFFYYGIWTYYAFQQTITGNEIWNSGARTGVKYGMYNYCYFKGGDYTIENNYIHDLGGSTTMYGIYHYAYYGSGSGDLKINKNRVILTNQPTSTYGIYVYGYSSTITGFYENNDNYIQLEKSSTGSNSYYYGIYAFSAYYLTSFKSCVVDRNTIRIKSYGGYGIYLYNYYNSSQSARSSINNNIVDFQSDGYFYGIFAYCYFNNQLTDISYNTTIGRPFSSTATSFGNDYHMYVYYVDGLMYNNNIVDLDNGGTNYGIYDYYSTGPYSNNNLFTGNAGASFNPGAKNGSIVSDLATFKTTMGDQNVMAINPVFTNLAAGDYKPTSFNFVNKATPISFITTDNANVKRNSTAPDVGALEYYIDVEVANVALANTNVCGGYKENITVTLKNNNTMDIVNVPLAFDVNGVRKVSEVCPITIGAGKSADFTFKTPTEFNFPGVSTLNVYLDGTDDNTGNNLISKTVNVTPSPYGGSLAENTSFPGYFRQGGSGGSTSNPDVTIPNLKITYDINNPTNNPTSTFGTDWTMTGEYRTSGGMTITSGVSLSGPSGSTLGTIEFTPSTSLMDSMVFIGARVTNTSTKCDSVFGRWVYIPHVPVVDFEFKPVCDGDVIEFKNLTTIAKGNILYDWQFNDPKSNEDATDVSDPIYKYVTYGNYNTDLTIRLAAYPKFEFKKTLQVVVTPVPTIDFKVFNACEGLAVNFANNTSLPAGIVGTINYTWNFGGAGSGDAVTTKNPKYTYSKAGGYKVTLTAVSNGCASSLTKNANQFAKPKASFTKAGNCNLEEISFTNKSTISIGNTGSTWYFGDGDISNLSDPVHVFQGAGAKSVKLVTTSEFGCKDSATVNFNLAESPKADFRHSDPCNLTETQFNMSGTKPAGVNSIFEWNFNGEGTSSNENPKYLFNNVGMKDITLIVRSANGCSDMITKSFPVKLQAKANFIANDVCEGDEVSFTNKSFVAAGDLQYEWRLGDGNTSNKTSPKHAYAASGGSKTFLVTLVANVPGGCSDSVTLPVNVNAKANAAFTAQTSGRTVKFSQTTTDPSNTYNWRFGDGGSAQTINPSHEYYNIDKGTFQACLGIINSAGCLSEKCETVTINLVSVEDISANGLNVYPNPSAGKLTVRISNFSNSTTLEVFNLLGERMNANMAEVGTGVFSIDLSHVANGIYMVQVKDGNMVSTQRVTISH